MNKRKSLAMFQHGRPQRIVFNVIPARTAEKLFDFAVSGAKPGSVARINGQRYMLNFVSYNARWRSFSCYFFSSGKLIRVSDHWSDARNRRMDRGKPIANKHYWLLSGESNSRAFFADLSQFTGSRRFRAVEMCGGEAWIRNIDATFPGGDLSWIEVAERRTEELRRRELGKAEELLYANYEKRFKR